MNKMKRLLSFLLAFSLVLGYVPMPTSAEEGCTHHTHNETCDYVEGAEDKPCTYEYAGCNPKPVCDCAVKCTELSETCPVCKTEITGCVGEETKAAQIPVDFLALLGEWDAPPVNVIFQSTADIDLHDYLVMAYGLDVPFTCQSAAVA